MPEFIALDKMFMKMLWVPDVYIFDLKSIRKHSLIHEFDGLYYINKTILYNVELEVVIYCEMDFEKFPFDSHTCFFKLGSFSYDASLVTFTLDQLSFTLSKQFNLLDFSTDVNPLPDSQKVYGDYGSLYWSLTGCEVVLKRSPHKYIFNYYVPSGLIVVFSWVSSEIIGDCLVNHYINVSNFSDQLCYSPRCHSRKVLFAWIITPEFGHHSS